MLYRICSSVLLCCAAAIYTSPFRSPAASCTPSFLSPAVCNPAHAVPPAQYPSGGDCELNEMDDCAPTTGTRCLDRYATAVAGTCTIKINETNPTGCTLNAGVTVVELPKYNAACSDANGPCQCVYTRDTQTTPAQVQVCDCTEQPL